MPANMVSIKLGRPLIRFLQLIILVLAGISFEKQKEMLMYSSGRGETWTGIVPPVASLDTPVVGPGSSSAKNILLPKPARKRIERQTCHGMRTAEEYKRCHYERLQASGVAISPAMAEEISCVEDHVKTWSDVQRCVNAPRKTPLTGTSSLLLSGRAPLERHIHLIGERHSGTKWCVEEIKKCFPPEQYNIKIHRDYLRPKHWFQPTGPDTLTVPLHNHYVISIFRDPVEWVGAMIEKPYHMLNHMKGFDENHRPIPLDWNEFVSRPYTMQGDHKRNETENINDLKCRYGFKYHQVTPCLFEEKTLPDAVSRGYAPIYELQRDNATTRTSMNGDILEGVPFDNILQLRSDKIKNFLIEIPLRHRLGGYHGVRYEDLVVNGTRFMLEQVGEMMGFSGGLPSSCKPQPPEPDRLERRHIPDGLRQWVNNNLVLETEQLLGYR